MDYNDSIVIPFAHNSLNAFYNPDSIGHEFSVTIGFYDSPPFQYVIRFGTVPYTGEIYIDSIQFSHAGEYSFHYSDSYERYRAKQETFAITVNSES